MALIESHIIARALGVGALGTVFILSKSVLGIHRQLSYLGCIPARSSKALKMYFFLSYIISRKASKTAFFCSHIIASALVVGALGTVFILSKSVLGILRQLSNFGCIPYRSSKAPKMAYFGYQIFARALGVGALGTVLVLSKSVLGIHRQLSYFGCILF